MEHSQRRYIATARLTVAYILGHRLLSAVVKVISDQYRGGLSVCFEEWELSVEL